MMKKICIIVALLILVLVLFYFHGKSNNNTVNDPKNLTYEIEGSRVNLQGGGSVRYFGNEVSGDFNNDSMPDSAFLATQDNGGSGTFYYLVVALSSGGKYSGTNGIFIGDRIAPQSTEFRNGEIIVNYADRKAGEPMTSVPSVGISKFFKVQNGKLIEIRR